MKLWVATSNPGKLREIKALSQGFQLEIASPADLSFFSYPAETGKTFEENARIKARSLKAVVGAEWVLGEDSGLKVKGLGDLPGVHSARYAGERASDAENVAKLLKMLQIKAVSDRSASFITSCVLYSPDGKEFVFEGELKGQINKAAKGTQGFGYDPVFIPEGHSMTFGELPPEAKNEISHRSRAFRQVLAAIGAPAEPQNSVR